MMNWIKLILYPLVRNYTTDLTIVLVDLAAFLLDVWVLYCLNISSLVISGSPASKSLGWNERTISKLVTNGHQNKEHILAKIKKISGESLCFLSLPRRYKNNVKIYIPVYLDSTSYSRDHRLQWVFPTFSGEDH